MAVQACDSLEAADGVPEVEPGAYDKPVVAVVPVLHVCLLQNPTHHMYLKAKRVLVVQVVQRALHSMKTVEATEALLVDTVLVRQMMCTQATNSTLITMVVS